MKLNRRELLKTLALFAALPGLASAAPRAKAERPLKILILGGTGFLGPHQVASALARGHQVTIFNRGKTNSERVPNVEHLVGDRETGNLDQLQGRKWDAAIDNCRDAPPWVQDSTRLLRDSVSHYLYVSSISAYADPSVKGLREDAPLQQLPPDPGAYKDPRNYGGAKAECERIVREAFPKRHTIPRPGLLVGPGDTTDRFTYWPVRLQRGGDVLCPGSPDDPSQWLDARDAADWMVLALEQAHYGIYNLAGPVPATTVGTLLETVNGAVGKDALLTWVPADFLEKHEVHSWTDMPCWVSPTSNAAGFTSIDNSKAVAAGFVTRSVAETAADTLAWYQRKTPQEPLKAGLSAEKEATVLEQWLKSSRGPTEPGRQAS